MTLIITFTDWLDCYSEEQELIKKNLTDATTVPNRQVSPNACDSCSFLWDVLEAWRLTIKQSGPAGELNNMQRFLFPLSIFPVFLPEASQFKSYKNSNQNELFSFSKQYKRKKDKYDACQHRRDDRETVSFPEVACLTTFTFLMS